MNFTLKNRPKLDAIPDETQSYVHIVKTLEWFEGFETELRCIFSLYDNVGYHKLSVQQRARYRFIKEILGDEK